MSEIEDWLQDPLREIDGGEYKPRKPKSLNNEQSSDWRLFHYTTRLKLNGANFFYTKVIDTARTSEDKFRWYLDTFFFELMAAYDTLLQELNTVYAYDLLLKPEAVRWKKIKGKLPNELVKYVEEERKKDWFCEVQWFRNLTTHHYRTPITSSRIRGSLHLDSTNVRRAPSNWYSWYSRGHDSLHTTCNVGLQYQNKEGEIKIKDISICKDYLSNMVDHISSVWGKMAQEFD